MSMSLGCFLSHSSSALDLKNRTVAIIATTESTTSSYPPRHLHEPLGKVHFPSPLHRYTGFESPTAISAFSTQVPLACSMTVTSLPVGVAGNRAKLIVTSGQVIFCSSRNEDRLFNDPEIGFIEILSDKRWINCEKTTFYFIPMVLGDN
ncbi:unnamed protein product [Leptidea sinapis]|uniref:Uncharacterized protein n=1 Tax=Leptidea sinapis TaxID=189913 RepID=A0A5E4PMG3_9NEOP|nr:unnamed protein product [Leptidea sinapis]